ncbi:MAG: hypothetical protein AMK74_01075 [Nitrospira bacterium SM23_35]|nr:MAG: hypothetical protein AMK74_01075 [Nitrospira bacterium SM23_35]
MTETGKKPVVEMRSITKQFLDLVANRSIDFTLFPGEICALLGENGAGKTTLMNILFGYYACDGGKIFIRGEKAELSCPRDAISRGVGMIHQHFTLVPSQSVLENIIIGSEMAKGFFLDLKSAKDTLLELQERFGLHIDPEAKIWTLSVGEQQRVEILKALYRDVEILIMDEPTAVLAPSEISDLFRTLQALAQEGKSIVFISHKLKEVMAIADRIVVLRGGEVVAERKTGDTNLRELANLMVGRDVIERITKKELPPGEPVLELRNLTVRNDKGLEAVKDITLTVRKNEICGIAGVSGNGQRELADVLFGIREPEKGTIKINGTVFHCGSPESAVKLGMARIPEDRIGTGLMMDLSVEENLILEVHASGNFHNRGLLNFNKIHQFCDELIKAYSIMTSGRDAVTKSLSGGNLQKVILARELAGKPSIIVASQPTRGLDVGAMEYIHQRILQEKERGAGIILISEDLDEILVLSDRVVVMYEGQIMGDVRSEQASREQIGLWMSGVKK